MKISGKIKKQSLKKKGHPMKLGLINSKGTKQRLFMHLILDEFYRLSPLRSQVRIPEVSFQCDSNPVLM